MEKFYNKKYFKERDHLDLHIATTIKILMQENGLKRVLDVGCGTGRLAAYLNENGFNAFGCDNSKEAVKMAQKNNISNSIVLASATKLPFQKGSFDLVTAISVIEHLTKRGARKFLSAAKRILRPGGFIFIVTPNYSTPIRYMQGKEWFAYKDPTHKTYYTPKSLSRFLGSHDFGNIKTRFKTSLDTPFDWDLPDFLRKLPKPAKDLITFLLISSPLSLLKNAFWIAAQKND